MPRRAPWLLGVSLLLLTVAAYAPLRENEFVDYDDELYLTANPPVLAGLSWSGFRWAWTTYHCNYWMPISWLSLELDGRFFSHQRPDGQIVLSPAAIHTENLVWHVASVLLLFHLLRRLTAAPWCSFLVAALFAVHPMHVESVAWASERKDVLMAFFGLVTLLAYVRYQEKPGVFRYLLVLAAYLLSLLSKPMLLTLPLVLLLLDYWPLRRLARGPGAPSLRRLLLEKAPLFLAAAGVGAAALLTRRWVGALVSLNELPLSARLANALTAYGWYLSTTLWPLHLSAFYPHPLRSWSVSGAATGAGVLLVLTGMALWQGRRRRWLLVGWLWFVITLLPVVGLAQGGSQAWADRFCYWPHIGLFVMLVWGLAELVGQARLPTLVVGAAGAALLGCLAWRTGMQVRTWHDTFTLWEHVLAVNPRTAPAHANLGKTYEKQGRLDRARSHLAEAVRLDPYVPDYQRFLGVVLLKLGHLDEAGAHFRRAIELEPHYADSWHNLGVVRLRQGKPAQAAPCFRKVLEHQPESTLSLAALGLALSRCGQQGEALRVLHRALQLDASAPDVWNALGTTYLNGGRLEEAVSAFRQSLRLQSLQVIANRDLGTALGRLGDWNEAVPCLQQAVEIQSAGEVTLLRMKGRPLEIDSIPQLVLLRCQLAFALKRQGDDLGASLEYQAARIGDPHCSRKLTARAWKLLTGQGDRMRDPRRAYELACQAAEATDEPSALTLAVLTATQAALGQIPEALTTAQRTLQRAFAAGEDLLSRERRAVSGTPLSANARTLPLPWDLPPRRFSPID